jgi:antitoxin (DNA-binding transcriptional repressor) of toxin-antitoxin stability system
MKKIEIAEATNSLSQYARELAEEPLVLTEGGHAVAALLPVDDADVESLTLSQSPKFQALIEQAREEYRSGSSLSADEARRELGL